VAEGDKLMKEVLNGGYNVHPVPPPNSETKERTTRKYERKRKRNAPPKMRGKSSRFMSEDGESSTSGDTEAYHT